MVNPFLVLYNLVDIFNRRTNFNLSLIHILLRRKQKEFAIETIIGMEQKTVAFLFFLETSVMGAAAILLGVLLSLIHICSLIEFGRNYPACGILHRFAALTRGACKTVFPGW